MDYTWHYDSPLGGMTLASDGKALVGLWFDDQDYFAETLEGEGVEKKLPIFEETMRWLEIYFSGKAPDFTPTLNLRATQFRKEVWEYLLSIPYGSTMTYGEIAQGMAKQKGVDRLCPRAVGGAVGRNPISIIIPCHRVVGAGRSLSGYAGGVERKIALLELEKVDMGKFSIPKSI